MSEVPLFTLHPASCPAHEVSSFPSRALLINQRGASSEQVNVRHVGLIDAALLRGRVRQPAPHGHVRRLQRRQRVLVDAAAPAGPGGPETRNPKLETMNPQPATRNPQPSTLNPQPSTLNPQPSTPTLNRGSGSSRSPDS
ncbi:hypothetical protein T484DRAFT_2941395 [Baffinella frigidus]|nr:hypothetical protein T484DRAFT_2941395 [Cryptophyta sp. CCMP2293]